jgi:hypothetical protein
MNGAMLPASHAAAVLTVPLAAHVSKVRQNVDAMLGKVEPSRITDPICFSPYLLPGKQLMAAHE